MVADVEGAAREQGEPEPGEPSAEEQEESGSLGPGQPAEREEKPVPRRGLLTLRLGPARFGLWIDEVLEIVRTPPISRLPLPHPELAGLTSVRGDLVPVLDLGLRLLGEPAERPGRLVLVRHEATDALVGLLVDAVDTLVGVPESAVEPPPRTVSSDLAPELVTGVYGHDDGVVTILHLGRAAAPPDANGRTGE